MVGNGLYLPGRIEGNGVSFDTGRHRIRGVHFGCTDVAEMVSCGGRANQVLGAAVFGRRTSARVPGQSTTYRDSRNSGHRVELHSGGNRRR